MSLKSDIYNDSAKPTPTDSGSRFRILSDNFLTLRPRDNIFFIKKAIAVYSAKQKACINTGLLLTARFSSAGAVRKNLE